MGSEELASALRAVERMPPLLLTPAQEELLTRARQALGDVHVALVTIGADQQARDQIAIAIRQLDELFLLVIVGEFNSGKSAFINALVGRPVLREGVTPTTSEINLLRYGRTNRPRPAAEGCASSAARAELLRHLHLVDTPGTNAIIREHEELTREFVPRADLVLFVTSADRPFTESERQFLSRIREWGKKIVFVINKVDLLAARPRSSEVASFVAAQAAGARRRPAGRVPGQRAHRAARRSAASRRCGRPAASSRWRLHRRRPSTRPGGCARSS